MTIYQGDPAISAEQRAQFDQLVALLRKEWSEVATTSDYDIDPKRCPSYASAVEKAAPEVRVNLLIFLIEQIRGIKLQQTRKLFKNKGEDHRLHNWGTTRAALVQAIARKTLPMSEEDIRRIFAAMFDENGLAQSEVSFYPIKYLLNQIKKQHPSPSETLKGSLKTARNQYQKLVEKIQFGFDRKAVGQVVVAFNELMGEAGQAAFPYDDDFAAYANAQLAALPAFEQKAWTKIITLALTANAAKPSEKYLKDSKAQIDELGADKFKKMLHGWINFIRTADDIVTERTVTPYYGESYTYPETHFPIENINQTIFKGLVWMCAHFHDTATITAIADLALHSYEKVPDVGARYQAIGNACFYTLYRSKGLDGIAQLTRLRLRIKFSNAQTAISKYLEAAAGERGVSRSQIEDMAVDDFKLQNHSRDYAFNDYTCRLAITGVGKSELQWFKPDGTPQKTVPSFVKDDFADKLKKIKATQKNLNTQLTAQRDRLDQMLRSEQRISREHAEQYYWQHGLMSYLTRPLIWQFYANDSDAHGIAALWLNNQWVNEHGAPIDVSGCLSVILWHPALANRQSIENWRKLLMAHEIRQPIKQAFREIYLLTEAELNTRTYSNRFAAHILKQHQYMTLAKMRGWKGSLGGAWDGGDDAHVTLDLPEYNLCAEFWANTVDGDEQSYTDAGIYFYVSTDQVRFHHLDDYEHPVELINIPPRVFSEVLRDVDLFVGVASVGNDPTWQDNGGLPRYYQYWQSYSFGDLSEVAKTRKAVLESLLPRLKIGKVAHIDGNFLVVQGKLRTYKIHIGSTNILMLPDDQYLCIVPDRSKKDVTDKLFIPFEGDNALSVVLSKAMLLADDDKITDSTITSQILRK